MPSPNAPSGQETPKIEADTGHSQTPTSPPPPSSSPPPQSSDVPEPAQAPDVQPAFAIVPPNPQQSQTLPQNKPATAARPHRAHFGPGHKQLGSRNLSQKNLNKFQKLATEVGAGLASANPPAPSKRQHSRKKSAPVNSAAESPESSKIRFDAHPPKPLPAIGHVTRPLMRRHLSTPVLHHQHRNPPTSKKSNMNPAAGDKQPITKRQKKVGFQLAPASSDTEDDDDEWEDNSNTASYTPSTTSTGQNSVVPSGPGPSGPPAGERIGAPSQPPLRSSLTKTYSTSDLARRNACEVDMKELLTPINMHKPSLLRLQPSSKASPSVSSINVSAVKPLHVDHSRETSHASTAAASSRSQAASSSAEVEVSRFLDSNNVPSSSPPESSSPATGFQNNIDASSVRRSRSPSGDYRLSDLASRTQQKLWLQRKEIAPMSPARTQAQTSNSAPTEPLHVPPAPSVDKERHDWKLYRKIATEFSVVHRFRDPVADSFRRLALLPGAKPNLPQENIGSDSKFHRSRSAIFGPFQYASNDKKKTPASNILNPGAGPGTATSSRPQPRRWNTQTALQRRDAHDQSDDSGGVTMRGTEPRQNSRSRPPLSFRQQEASHPQQQQQAAYNQTPQQPWARRLPVRAQMATAGPGGADPNPNHKTPADQEQRLPYPPRYSEKERLLERLWNMKDAV